MEGRVILPGLLLEQAQELRKTELAPSQRWNGNAIRVTSDISSDHSIHMRQDKTMAEHGTYCVEDGEHKVRSKEAKDDRQGNEHPECKNKPRETNHS